MKIFVAFLAVLALVLSVQAYPHRSQESDEDAVNRYSFADTQRENNRWKSQVPRNWINDVNNSADAEPFLNKFKQRLNNSNRLASQSDVRDVIEELGCLKLYRCKSLNSNNDQQEVTLDKGCAGRWLGQMMQFVNTIESVSQEIPQLTHHIRNQN